LENRLGKSPSPGSEGAEFFHEKHRKQQVAFTSFSPELGALSFNVHCAYLFYAHQSYPAKPYERF
jgi:hypothetical protein